VPYTMKARHLVTGLILIALTALLPLAFPSPEVRIIDPRYAVPVVVVPGQSFNATLQGVRDVSGAWIAAPGFNVSLLPVKSWRFEDTVTVLLEVPKNAMRALYDLCMSTSELTVCEPRSVWVLEREPDRLAIAHLTDIHVEIIIGGVRSTLYLETALNLVNTLPVDIAVVTGDCVDVGSHVDSLKKLQELINRVRKPTFLLPGNHDHSQTDEKSFNEVYYGRYVGPATWYRVFGNFLLAALDTGYAGYVDPSQLVWLEGVLSAHKDKVKILMMHHPLFRAGLFREIDGSWREIDNLKAYLYSSWANRLDVAGELLRLIEEYNVTAVLAGHVHTDGLVIYNGRTWFVTTIATCGSADYRGFKIVEVERGGRVRVIGIAGKDPLREPSSFVLDGSLIRVIPTPDLKAANVVGYISPALGIDLKQLTVYMYLNSSLPAEAYTVYGDSALVREVATTPYGSVYLAKLTVDVPSEWFRVTLSSFKDEAPPSVSLSLYTPARPVAARDSVTLYIKAQDEGWGVWRVYVDYETDTARGTLIAQEIASASYQAALPPLNATSVRLTVRAVDFAGNVGTETAEIQYIQPVVQQPTEQQPTEEQPTQPEQPAQPLQPTPQQPPALIVAAVVIAAVVAVVLTIVVRRRR